MHDPESTINPFEAIRHHSAMFRRALGTTACMLVGGSMLLGIGTYTDRMEVVGAGLTGLVVGFIGAMSAEAHLGAADTLSRELINNIIVAGEKPR